MRCFGDQEGKEFYADYHDREWGVPSHDDRHLFEMLVLESTQAGLSWEMILRRREAYRRAFHNFDPHKVAAMDEDELEALRENRDIIRNRLKIYAARQNAHVFLKIAKEFGSFDSYIWGFVEGKPIKNNYERIREVPCLTPLSALISKDLKKRGMTFVGPKIIYSFMQAVGIVNDHIKSCFRYTSNG